MSQHSGQTHATCCAQQCCDMLRWHVAIVWLGLYEKNPHPILSCVSSGMVLTAVTLINLFVVYNKIYISQQKSEVGKPVCRLQQNLRHGLSGQS